MPVKLRGSLLTLAVAAFLCSHWTVRAADKPEALAEPVASEAEVKEAQALLDKADRRQLAVISGLRYLLRSQFEDDIFEGRWRETAPIAPFDGSLEGPLDLAEQLRLWAVLETGLVRSPSMDQAFRRLAATPVPEVRHELAPVGLYLLVTRSALARLTGAESGKLLESARKAAAAAKAATNACAPQSYWASDSLVTVEWYANHFWRAVVNRCTADMGLGAEYKQWGRDLDFLNRAFVEGLGWVCQRKQGAHVDEDLHANLLAMAAFGLAAGAPAGQFGKSDLKEIEVAQARMPAVLARLELTYAQEPLHGGRLALVQAFGAAPRDHKDPVGWRNALNLKSRETLLAMPSRAFRTNLPYAFSFNAPQGAVDPLAVIAEAAFGLAAECGGFVRAGDGPLAKMGLPEVGRLIHALALVEAARAPRERPLPPALARARAALAKAREFLVKIQNPDGSFGPEKGAGGKLGTGPQCLALLALLHAGEPRESQAVKRAMKYLEGENFSMRYETYEASVQLMLLEKYFEKELIEAGMYEVTNMTEYNRARDRVVGLMPRSYRELARSRAKLIQSKRQFELDGFDYACGGMPRPAPAPKTPAPSTPGALPPPRKNPNPAPARPVSGERRPKPWNPQSGWDNSNSQFAMLGLKAACMLAIDVPVSFFRNEVERLIGDAEEDHELPHMPMQRPWKALPPPAAKRGPRSSVAPQETAHPYKFQYRPDWSSYLEEKKTDADSGSFGCTAGCVSSMALCFDELKLRGEWGKEEMDGELEKFSDHVLWGGLGWLAQRFLKPSAKYSNRWHDELTAPASASVDGVGFYYDAWSLERACVMTGATVLAGGVNWYEVLVDMICERQLGNGAWGLMTGVPQARDARNNPIPAPAQERGTVALVNTAFAVLTLAKAAPTVLSPSRRGPEAAPRVTPSPRGPTSSPGEGKPDTGEPRKGPATGQ